MTFTIIGSTGYVGRGLVRYLEKNKLNYFAPSRNDPSLFSNPLGHIIYCAGYTADFREKKLETVEAHVCLLRQIIAHADFQSLLYLSSTRVYQRSTSTDEIASLQVNPHDPGDIYNLSKLMGESLCLSVDHPPMRVVRLSNVYGEGMGSENFLGSLISEAVEKKEICLKSSLHSTKDYLYLEDIPPLLVAIAKGGKERVYNLASGYNLSNHEILKLLISLTGCKLVLALNPPEICFPKIQIERIKKEFSFSPTLLEHKLSKTIESFLDTPMASK